MPIGIAVPMIRVRSRLPRGDRGVDTQIAGAVDCAREDDIADRVEQMFPVSDEHMALIKTAAPLARAAYMNVFEDLTTIQQITIQANAERQGAAE